MRAEEGTPSHGKHARGERNALVEVVHLLRLEEQRRRYRMHGRVCSGQFETQRSDTRLGKSAGRTSPPLVREPSRPIQVLEILFVSLASKPVEVGNLEVGPVLEGVSKCRKREGEEGERRASKTDQKWQRL